MALTTSQITGRVPMPDDTASKAAEVIFTLSGFDTEGNQVIPGGASRRFVLDADGNLPAGAELWRNTEGMRGTAYRVMVRWVEADRRNRAEDRTNDLGWIQVGDDASYTLPDLLANPAGPAPGWYETVPKLVWEALVAGLAQIATKADQTALDAEVSARIARQTANADAIAAETLRATSTEAGLQTQVNTKAAQSDLTAETSNRIGGDVVNAAAIAAETARATGGEAGLQTQVNQRAPGGVALSSQILAALLDAAGYPTDFELRRSDGKFTDRVVAGLSARLAPLLGLDIRTSETILAAMVDAAGYVTDLELRRSDGRLSDRVVGHLAARAAAMASLELTATSAICAVGSSTIDIMGGALGAMCSSLGVEYRHMGDSGARSDLLLAAMGVEPYVAGFPGDVIPASGSVSVAVPGGIGSAYSNALECYVEGTGILGVLTSDSGTGFSFSRSVPGDAPTRLTGPVRLIPVTGAANRRCVQIVNLGKNDALFGDAGWQQRMIRANLLVRELHPTIDRRVLCMGHFTSRDADPHAAIAAGITAANAAMRDAYGAAFFDLAAYLAGSAVWVDTGITATSDDLAAQAAGRVPPSLALDNTHLNAAANTAVVARLRAKMISLGWYED